MTDPTMPEGFEDDPYEAEARECYGDAIIEDTKARMASWSPADAERARTGYSRVHQRLAGLRADGVAVDDDRVQALIAEHHELTSLFWTPTAESYRGLGQTYVDDPRFTRNIGQGNDALVAYLRDAMTVYADAHLT